MNIQEIRLSKSFRRNVSNQKEQNAWYVFGHYDNLDITQITQNNSFHPLENLLEKSHNLTFGSSGTIKQHIFYIMSTEEECSIAEFWQEAYKKPLLLISLVHFVHPLSGDDNKQAMQQAIDDIKNAIRQANNVADELIYSVYTSIDSNDLIIIWSASSFQHTMALISKVWGSCHKVISEVFTIQACQMGALMKTEHELYDKWCNCEEKLKCVRVHIRGSDYMRIMNLAETVLRAVESREKDQSALRVNRYVIPGQEDIVLVFENIPVSWFIDMYRERKPDESDKDPLIGILHEGIISRSVIDTFISSNDFVTSDYKLYNPMHPNVIQQKYNLLKNEVQKAGFPQTQWLAALYELMIELSYNEVNPTAYDIYVQSRDCQAILVDQLVKIITKRDSECKEAYAELIDSQSDLVRCIQQYIQGWSQLSFHAMLAELQLTQTSDINRMYLYPAKLNRIYASFMDVSSDALNAVSKRPRARFFLTPSMRTDAEFLSVFNKYHDTALLVLGEIPADLMFSPQVLLPVLVHEAAHYSGYIQRNREYRYECLVRSMLYHVLYEHIDSSVLFDFDGERYTVEICIDKLYENFPTPSKKDGQSSVDYYGEEIRSHILLTLHKQLQSQPGFGHYAFIQILNESKYDNFDRMQKRIFMQRNAGETSNIRSLNEVENYNNIVNHFDQLITIYREAFSDLCMICLLNLNVAEYLGIIYRSNRFANRSDEYNRDFLRQWIRFERYLCVIGAAYGEERIQDELESVLEDEKMSDLHKYDAIDENDIGGIRSMAKELLVIYRDDEPEVFSSPYERMWLLAYLEKAKSGLQYMDHNQLVNNLREVYDALAKNVRTVPGDKLLDTLSPCLKIIRNK